MALIGTIRKNGWILVATMILALAAFILMTIFENQQNYSAGDQNTVAMVNGKEIRYEKFQQYQEAIYANAQGGNDLQIKSQVWNEFVEDIIVREQAEKAGLGVSRTELMDLQFGQFLSPVINERFGQGGRVDRNQLDQIKAAIEGGQLDDPQYASFRQRWAIQEDEIIKRRLQDKMLGMVNKSMFTPAWQAEMAFREGNERLSFLYVRVPYDKVTDTEAPVTDADYKAYLAQNPKLYDQPEETRVLSYVSFDVVPTASDSSDARDRVAKMASGLGTKSDSVTIVNNGGTWGADFLPKSALPASAADRLMSAPIDSIVGPFLDGGSWTVAKILERKVMPDSVRARHILRPANAPDAEKVIDSLKLAIESGKTTFDAAAKSNSSDGSAAKGGDLGFFANGAMVPEFNNVCFNTGVQGKLYKVATQFGWHLIEITGKKFIKNETSLRAAFLSEQITPSRTTERAVKDKAQALLQSTKSLNDLTATALQQNVQVQTSPAVKVNDYTIGVLGSGSDAREILRWAFDSDNDNEDAKVGQLAKQIFTFKDPGGGNFDSRYVVAGLKAINPKGGATVEAIKNNPAADLEVKNRKKADVIRAKIGSSDLAMVAGMYGTVVDTSVNSTMLQGGIAKVGGEPRVVGAAFGTPKGTTSKPVAGRSGVYLVQPISDVVAGQTAPDLTMFRRQVTSTNSAMVRGNLLNSLKKNADIKDNRSRFF
jgi:peptidyl-prolyl cis-trans isomerase D